VDDHRDEGDDQEQVNKPASNVKCEQTKAPAHSENNGQDQEHRISFSEFQQRLRLRLDSLDHNTDDVEDVHACLP
jgi:hypothetical protein